MKRGNARMSGNEFRGWMRHALAAMLAVVLALGTWSGAWAAEGQTQPAPAGPSRAQLEEALASLQASLGKAEPLTDWVAIALARSGKPAASRYLPQAEKNVGKELRLVTDYARIALAVNANGGDVRSFGTAKLDLLSKIANFENITAQGPNAPAYALLALDAGGYIPGSKDRWSRDDLIKWLVDHRNADGGWSLAPGKSDVDVTGIVLTAFAPYTNRNDVKAAVDAALEWLSGVQRDNGGFGSPESSESSVQSLIALTSLGIDPEKDPRFVKNGKSALARLMEFRTDDGKFAHLPGGKADELASLYAFLGLTAAERFQDGLPTLYAGVRTGVEADVLVYGPHSQIVEGRVSGRTALESLLAVLRGHDISYQLTKYPELGPMLTDVAGAGGSLNGYWMLAVERGGRWVDIIEGMGTFVPQAGDRIFVYYAGSHTSLIHSVKLEPEIPREGQKVKISVEKEAYDENFNKMIRPAAGAEVRISGQIVTTDENGKAEFTAPAAGKHTLSIVGYREGQTPDYLAVRRTIEVASHMKNVRVRVEGDRGVLAAGTAKGGTALEALENLLKAKNVPYEVKDSSFGKYVVAIGGTAAGKYGGYDGWSAAVKNGSSWIVPAESLGTFLMEEGQELVVYYGDNTKLPEAPVLMPSAPKPGQPVTVSLTYTEMDWDSGTLKDPQALAGARITAGGLSATTDADGKAVLPGLPEGVYNLVASGYAVGKAPSVVRVAMPVTVAADYNDQSKISAWAVDSVRTARAAGVLRGPNDSSAGAFSPNAAVTRAEFVSALVRSLGLKPAGGSDFKDVADKAWYAGDIQAAAKAGLIAGVAPGKFAPQGKLTREQAAQLLARALKIQAKGPLSIQDAGNVSASAKAAVQAVLEQGWMTAFEGKFSPKQTMPREQAAVIAVRILFRPELGKLGK